MNDLTNLIMKYYGCATYNSGKNTIQQMIIAYNQTQKMKVPTNAAWCAILLYNLCRFLKYDIQGANAWVASWCNLGNTIMFEDAQMGDIVIIGDNVNQTHISTFVRWSNDGTYAYLLGGNQGNQINIMQFPEESIFKIIRLNKLNQS